MANLNDWLNKNQLAAAFTELAIKMVWSENYNFNR